MTVGELLEALKTADPGSRVCFPQWEAVGCDCEPVATDAKYVSVLEDMVVIGEEQYAKGRWFLKPVLEEEKHIK